MFIFALAFRSDARQEAGPAFDLTNAVIPMHDRVKPNTNIFAPKNAAKPLPIREIAAAGFVSDALILTLSPGRSDHLALAGRGWARVDSRFETTSDRCLRDAASF